MTNKTQLNWKALEIKYFIVLKASRIKKKVCKVFERKSEGWYRERDEGYVMFWDYTDIIELQWPNFQLMVVCIPQRSFTVLYRLSGSLPATLLFELAGFICHIFYSGLEVTVVWKKGDQKLWSGLGNVIFFFFFLQRTKLQTFQKYSFKHIHHSNWGWIVS